MAQLGMLGRRLGAIVAFWASSQVAGCTPNEPSPDPALAGGDGPVPVVPVATVNEPPPVRDPQGPLCPDCIALGGETGDFTGGGVPPADTCPPYKLVDTDLDFVVPESGLSARAAIAFLEQEIHLPAVWQPTGNPNNPLDVQRELSGFSQQTAITLSIEVTGVKRLEWLPDAAEFPASTNAECDGLVLAGNVSVTTEDGALIGTFQGATVQVFSKTEAELLATADIKDFTGSLELDPRPGEGLAARLELSLNANQVRGLLEPYVQVSPPQGELYYWYRPVQLRWPGNDTCNDYSFPYAGEEGAQRVALAVAALAASSPYTGQYLGPPYRFDSLVLGETEVALDVGSPSNVCQGRERSYYARSPGQYFEFELAARLQSADGHYDLSLPLSVMARSLPDGTIGVADARYYSRAVPIEEFRSRFGIDWLDFGSAECAQLTLEYQAVSARPYRLLMVEAGACGPLGPQGVLLDERAILERLGG